MLKTIISEGKTTNEAIENGLKKLNVSKNQVDIKILKDEDKRSFFSILAPKTVKVELTVKENSEKEEVKLEKIAIREKKEIVITEQELEKAQENLNKFLDEVMKTKKIDATYKIYIKEKMLNVEISGKDSGILIGYRGETLGALQNILSAIANKGIENKVIVLLDIENYKEKREKTLEELANKLAKTVVRTKKTITLEPMQAYERRIIHSTLQNHKSVETTSVGQEPRRKVVISLKNN